MRHDAEVAQVLEGRKDQEIALGQYDVSPSEKKMIEVSKGQHAIDIQTQMNIDSQSQAESEIESLPNTLEDISKT